MKGWRVWRRYGPQAAALLCVLALQCCFAFRKEGYHMDEMISFEMSNAEYNPWIVPTQPVGRLAKFIQEEIRGEDFVEAFSNLTDTVWDVVKNKGGSKLLQYKADVYPDPVWIGSEAFTDYVTAGGSNRFNYLSVYFNERDDVHPPLHSMLLHTMSSLFPERIFPFLGCFINIAAVLGCMLLMFRLGDMLDAGGVFSEGRGRWWSLCAALLYGLSSGAIATVLLIRMYGLMTFFCVALFYLHMKKWMGKGFGKKNKGLTAVTALGFWTQYFFLFYCIPLAAVNAGLLAAKKRYRELGRYVAAMVCAAVLGVAVFPFSVKAVLSSDRGVEAVQNLSQGLAGYGVRLAAFGRLLLEGIMGNAALCAVVLLCLTGGAVWCLRKRKAECGAAGEGKAKGLGLLLVIPPCCYFLLTARMAPYLVDRYIMPLFPFAAMTLAFALTAALGMFPRAKGYLALVPVFILAVFQAASYDGRYLYQGYEKQVEVARQYGELPCVCLYEGYGFYYNIIEFMEYDRTLLTRLSELEERQDRSELLDMERLVLLRKSGVEEEGLGRVLELYGWEVEEVLLQAADSVHGDTVYLCRRSSAGQ